MVVRLAAEDFGGVPWLSKAGVFCLDNIFHLLDECVVDLWNCWPLPTAV